VLFAHVNACCYLPAYEISVLLRANLLGRLYIIGGKFYTYVHTTVAAAVSRTSEAFCNGKQFLLKETAVSWWIATACLCDLEGIELKKWRRRCTVG
jgi:hypothetical protein